MMGKGRAKAQALLLAALVLMISCSAAAYPSNCIPRRLLVAMSRSYYQRPPCNDDQMDRPTPSGTNDGMEKPAGSRIPRGGPPPPIGGRSWAQSVPATKPPPGSNN